MVVYVGIYTAMFEGPGIIGAVLLAKRHAYLTEKSL